MWYCFHFSDNRFKCLKSYSQSNCYGTLKILNWSIWRNCKENGEKCFELTNTKFLTTLMPKPYSCKNVQKRNSIKLSNNSWTKILFEGSTMYTRRTFQTVELFAISRVFYVLNDERNKKHFLKQVINVYWIYIRSRLLWTEP